VTLIFNFNFDFLLNQHTPSIKTSNFA